MYSFPRPAAFAGTAKLAAHFPAA